MLESIWESFVYILSRGPGFGLFGWLDDSSSWRRFGSFTTFLSVLSAIYFFYKGDIGTGFLYLSIAFFIYLLIPDEDGIYPTWKFLTLMVIFLVFGIWILSVI